MKILYCLLGTYNSSGMERIVVAKANALAEHGHSVYIVTTEQNGRPDFYPLHPGVQRFDADVMYSADAGQLSPIRKFFVRRSKIRRHREFVRQTINRVRPDVVISTFGNEISFLPRIAGQAATVAEIHFPRNYRLLLNRKGLWRLIDRFLTFTDRRAVRRYNRFVVLTKADAANWGKLNSLTVIPNFITGISHIKAPLESKRIIAVGRLEAQKDYPKMIEVWEQVHRRHPDWTLEIYGDGSERTRLTEMVERKGLGQTIKFMGVTRDMTAVYSRASAMIHTAAYEGYVLVLPEAMTAGLPIVAFNCPYGPAEMITDGVNGFLIPPGDIASMAAAVCRLISDTDLRHSMGEASFAMADNFAAGRVMPQWEALLREVADGYGL